MRKNTKGIIIVIAMVIPAIIIAVALTGGKSEAPTYDRAAYEQKETESAAATETAATNQAGVTVEIRDYAYTPATVTVKAGTTVTWTNKDDMQHNIVATVGSPNAPNSGLLDKGESYSFTFNKVGTYDYHCTPHPYMKGKVVVTE